MRKTTPDACRTQQNRPGQWWRSRLLALAALGARVAARPVDPLARRQDTTTPTATTNASSSVTSQDSATTDTSATDTVTSPTPTAASTSLTSTSSDFTSTTPTSTTSISSQTQSSSATTTGATTTSASITSLSSTTSPVETTETRTSTVPASTSTVATTSPSNGITTTRFSSSTTPTITSTPTTAQSSSTSTPPVITSTSVSSVSTSDPVVSTSSSSSTTSTSDTSTSSDVTSTTTSSTSDTTTSATTSTDTATTTSETRTSTSNSTTTSDTTTSTSDSTTSTSATTTSTPDTTTNTSLPTNTSTSDTTTTTSETTTPTSETSTVTTSPSSSDSGIPTTTTSTSISDTKTPTSTSSTATSTSKSATSTSSGTSTSPSSSTGSLTESQSSSALTSTRPQPTTSSTSDTTTTSESSKEFTSLSETTMSSTTSSAASSVHVGNPADPSTTRTITGFHTSTIFQTVTTVRTGDSSTWVETTVVQTATLVPNGPSAPNSASFAHNPGAIAGTTVGILLLLVAIAVWAVFARRRAKTRRMEQNALAFGPKDDVFRPPLDESEEDLSGRPALMSERMRGGRRSTITASGLVAVTPASTSGYDSLARAAPQGMEDDGLMSEEEADEYSADLNHPDIASSNGHYVTAPTTPMPLLGTVQDPMDGTAVAGVAAAGATVLGATSRRRSGPPSPIIPRSRPSSNIEPGMWYTGKINDALIDAPASPGFSSGDGHDSNGGMASSSQGHPQTHSSGHEPMSGLNTRTSSDLQHGVWRPVGYGSSGSSTGHEFGKLQPAPRRPLATRADQSGSGSGSSSDPRRSFSPSREYGQGSGSSVGHGIAAVARAGESGSSTGHGMASVVPILVRGSREITRTPSPKIGSRSGSSHGHGTSSHGHGGPPSSQGHEASSSGHGHQRRSGQPSRVSFVEKDHPPTAFRSRSTASPTALRSTPSSPITPMRDEPLSRTGSTRSTKSYIKKSLRGRFSRRKSDAAKLTVDTDDQVASSSRGPSSPRSRAPVPTFFQSPQAAAHEQLMSQNIHISPPNSPILASSGAASSPLPPGAGYALPRPGSLGQFPNWQPTIASLAHEDAHNHEDETAWAWPGLSPGVTLPPLPSPGAESVNTPEGLLDPALASRFSRVQSANHSTAAISLGDHEDYTRPIGALSQQRMNSSTTVQTRSSQRTFDTDTGSHYSTHTVQDEHV